jgi:hypothetical protein
MQVDELTELTLHDETHPSLYASLYALQMLPAPAPASLTLSDTAGQSDNAPRGDVASGEVPTKEQLLAAQREVVRLSARETSLAMQVH